MSECLREWIEMSFLKGMKRFTVKYLAKGSSLWQKNDNPGDKPQAAGEKLSSLSRERRVFPEQRESSRAACGDSGGDPLWVCGDSPGWQRGNAVMQPWWGEAVPQAMCHTPLPSSQAFCKFSRGKRVLVFSNMVNGTRELFRQLGWSWKAGQAHGGAGRGGTKGSTACLPGGRHCCRGGMGVGWGGQREWLVPEDRWASAQGLVSPTQSTDT